MSDVTHPQAIAKSTFAPRERTTPTRGCRALLYGLVAAGVAAGLLVGRVMDGEAADIDRKLLLLLRFMAFMKALGVLAAVGLTHWRLSHPIAPRLLWSYASALAVMATGTGLIWSLRAIALGAILFHAGLLGFLVLAWRDDGARLPRRS